MKSELKIEQLTRSIKAFFDLGADAAYDGRSSRVPPGTFRERRAYRKGYTVGVEMARQRDVWDARKIDVRRLAGK